jgi:hypothetical protein
VTRLGPRSAESGSVWKIWTAGTPDPDEGLRAFEHTVIKDQRTAKWTANILLGSNTRSWR